jgi:hypothetical protein
VTSVDKLVFAMRHRVVLPDAAGSGDSAAARGSLTPC